MSVPDADPLVGREFLESHRSACMELLRTDGDFGSQSKLAAIGEASACVDVHSGRMDFVDELVGVAEMLGQDRVGVFGAMLVDVCDGFFDVVHETNAQDQREPFLVEVFGSSGITSDGGSRAEQDGFHLGRGFEQHVAFLQALRHSGQEDLRDVAVYKQSVKGVAYRRTLHFGIFHDINRPFEVCVFVHKDMTDADSARNDGDGALFSTKCV